MPKFITTAFLFASLLVPSSVFAGISTNSNLADSNTYDTYRVFYIDFDENGSPNTGCLGLEDYYIDAMTDDDNNQYVFGEGTISATNYYYNSRFLDMSPLDVTASDWRFARYYFVGNPSLDLTLNCSQTGYYGYTIDSTDGDDVLTRTPNDLEQPLSGEILLEATFDSLNNMGDFFQFRRGADSLCNAPETSSTYHSWNSTWSDDLDLSVGTQAYTSIQWSESDVVNADGCFDNTLTGYYTFGENILMTGDEPSGNGSTSTPDQTQQTTFNGFVVFGFTMWFTIWLFRKRR